MKNFVITIMDNPKSVQSAERCIASGKAVGINIEKFPAIIPAKLDVRKEAKKLNLPIGKFLNSKYSNEDSSIAAFLSHHALWCYSASTYQEVTVFEHDAYVVSSIPDIISYNKVINLGKPSYGRYNTPNQLGVGPLVSKPYFPGAHAYRINWQGAMELTKKAIQFAQPTDIFLNVNIFPWLEEYYPWPVEARDTFTTIQKKEGCLAKHNWNKGYQIL